jgi:hypothetical protein
MVGVTMLVLAFASAGCGDDDGGCTDECDVVNTAQCSGTIIQICSQGADGCLGWVDSVDCADSLQVCDDSTANVICASDCTDQCAADGDTQCSGTVIETCQELPNGCLDWAETSDCADLGLLCEDYTGDASCMEECVDECNTLTDTQCSGTVIETCVTGPDGCLDWEGGTDCADTSELCDDSTGDAGCVINCALSGPAEPAGPTPAHQATDVDESAVTSVNWADSNGATSYDVYFGDTCPPPAYPDASFQNVTASELTGLTLATDTQYCWQVVAIDSECAVQGQVWTFHTTCVDPVAGPPTVTSTLATLYAIGTTADSYTLTFSEDVSGVITGLTWTPVTGSGTLGTVTQVDPQTYTVPFSGVVDGDQYTLTVTVAITDVCGIPLTAAVDIAISIDAVSAGTWANCTDVGTLQLGVPASPPTLPTGDTLNDGSGSCWPEDGADVIATYTATSTDALLFSWTNVSLVSGIYRNYEIWRNSCDPAVGVEEHCTNVTADSGTAAIYNVNVGDIFYMKAIAEDSGDDFTAATFQVEIAPPPPTGTVCSDPIDLDTTGVPHQELGSFDTNNAVGGSCDTVADHAVWYNFTPPVTGWYTIDATNADTASFPYSRIAVFETTACNPYGAEVACQLDSSNAITVGNLQLDAGITYTIMFYTDGTLYVMVDPTIDIRSQAPPPPGSTCDTAIDLDSVGVPYQAAGTFTNAGGTGGSCDTTTDNAVWYTWTSPADGWYSIDASNMGSSTSSRLAIFETASCTPLGTELECFTTSSASFTVDHQWLTAGTTYTIVHYTSSSSNTMVDPTIDLGPGTAPPPGETCALPTTVGASNHTVDASGHDCWLWNPNLADTVNDHSFTCDGAVGGDVVIEYTTGAAETTLEWNASIFNYDSLAYIGLEITDAPCTTGASRYCTSAGTTGTFSDTGTLTVLPNTTYYVWLSDAYANNHLPGIDVCLWSY